MWPILYLKQLLSLGKTLGSCFIKEITPLESYFLTEIALNNGPLKSNPSLPTYLPTYETEGFRVKLYEMRPRLAHIKNQCTPSLISVNL